MYMDTANIPAPPSKLIPNAPDLGIFSDTKPSMVGQKYATPKPNTIAPINIAPPLKVPNKYIPSVEIMADTNNKPAGDTRCTTGPATLRASACTAATSASTRMALLVTFCNNTPTHWLVKSSVIAVPNMQINKKIYKGVSTALYISFVDTPDDTRSVTGKSRLKN